VPSAILLSNVVKFLSVGTSVKSLKIDRQRWIGIDITSPNISWREQYIAM